MRLKLYSGNPQPPPVSTAAITSGTGYSSGGYVQNPSITWQIGAALSQQSFQPYLPRCQCPACTARGQNASHPAPPRRARTPAPARGMDGFDGADFVAGTLYGYRWWTLQAPPGVAMGLSPAECACIPEYRWEPGLLRGTRDVWLPGVNQAKCLPYGGYEPHEPGEIPHPGCADGFWAYWQVQEHEMGGVNSLPVVGVMKGSGNVLMGPLGFRAGRAEIAALYLPLRLDPFPRQADAEYQTRALPGSGYTVTHRKFTGKVYNYGNVYVPAPFRDDPPPAPSPEETAEAEQRAQAWMAVIEDRLQQMYPGAEVCASLEYMLRKYPVTNEWAAEQKRKDVLGTERIPVRDMFCPFCAQQVEVQKIYKHISEKHSA